MYNSLRVGKIKTRDKMNKTAAHNFRLHSQPNIDASQTPNNRVLLNTLKMDLTQRQGFAKAFLGHYTAKGVKEKEDNVLAVEMVITASPEMFEDKPKQMLICGPPSRCSLPKKSLGRTAVWLCCT